MKTTIKIIAICVAALSLVGCDTIKSLHSKYQSQATIPADVFGSNVKVTADTTVMTEMSWREFFTDPLLQ